MDTSWEVSTSKLLISISGTVEIRPVIMIAVVDIKNRPDFILCLNIIINMIK